MAGKTRGIVFDIERFAITDGPGIRTTVFLKGCPLRCAWCQNPEGMNRTPELLYYEHLCAFCGHCAAVCVRGVHEVSGRVHALARERCIACGACAGECPTDALAVAGREMTVAGVMDVVLRDRTFYERSRGGVTLSGGEAMAQPEFAAGILSASKAGGLHTAVDTAGLVPWSAFETVLPLVDLFLFDVKDTDPARHLEMTGAPLGPILENLRRLDAAGAFTLIRAPIVPGINDSPSHMEALALLRQSLANCSGLEILRWHRLGLPKWRALGRAAREFPRAGDVPVARS